MTQKLIYECDKCGKRETVDKLFNGISDQPVKGWLIVSVNLRSISAGRPAQKLREEAGCLCKECAEKLGWAGPEAQQVTFEDLIREIVQEEMEP